MLEFSEMQFAGLAVHQVGNKSKEQGCKISNRLYPTDQLFEKTLKKYFLKPFKADDIYQFVGDDGNFDEHAVFNAATAVFDDPDRLLEQSAEIAQLLYKQSEHPHIKSGEVFITLFRECVLDGELVDALGIFKAEIKDNFMLVDDEPENIRLNVLKGINTKKLDKGCLIFNTQKENGYRVLSVDQNNYDAQYWMDDFLALKLEENETFHTKNFIGMVQEFARDVVAPSEDVTEEIKVVNKSMDYFEQNETFDEEAFVQEVFKEQEPQVKEQFTEFKQNYQDSFGFQFEDDFEISEPAVKTMQKKVKTAINLDTNIQIKLDFNDADSSDKFLEKGYDEEKEMYFYKVYFNHEKS